MATLVLEAGVFFNFYVVFIFDFVLHFIRKQSILQQHLETKDAKNQQTAHYNSMGLPYKRLGSTQIWHCDQMSPKRLSSFQESFDRPRPASNRSSSKSNHKRFSWLSRSQSQPIQEPPPSPPNIPETSTNTGLFLRQTLLG